MNYNLKKRIFGTISTMLATVFVLMAPGVEVQASDGTAREEEPIHVEVEVRDLPDDYFKDTPTARTTLTNCFILYSCSEDGLEVDISTGAARTASVLGVKDIKVEQKVWYGWKTVLTSDGYEVYNRASSGCSFVYDAEVGETYRISCVHYGTVDEYTEIENDTGSFEFQY